MRLSPPLRRPGLTTDPYSTNDPVAAAYQAVRLEILAAAFEGHPEEQWMILDRLEIACLQAGHPDEAAAAHGRAVASAGRSGYAARERWERSPRWFKLLTRRFRTSLERRWTGDGYLRGARAIEAHLSDIASKHRRKRPVAA